MLWFAQVAVANRPVSGRADVRLCPTGISPCHPVEALEVLGQIDGRLRNRDHGRTRSNTRPRLIWNRAIASIGVARTAVFLYWVPVFGVLFAAMLLDERLTTWHLVGFAAVMGGTFLGTRPSVPPSSTS